MARIKRAVAAKKKRRTVMHRAKGYYGAASRKTHEGVDSCHPEP